MELGKVGKDIEICEADWLESADEREKVVREIQELQGR
jgi:hypothetical protein